jgi:hypothetical protein
MLRTVRVFLGGSDSENLKFGASFIYLTRAVFTRAPLHFYALLSESDEYYTDAQFPWKIDHTIFIQITVQWLKNTITIGCIILKKEHLIQTPKTAPECT